MFADDERFGNKMLLLVFLAYIVVANVWSAQSVSPPSSTTTLLKQNVSFGSSALSKFSLNLSSGALRYHASRSSALQSLKTSDPNVNETSLDDASYLPHLLEALRRVPLYTVINDHGEMILASNINNDIDNADHLPYFNFMSEEPQTFIGLFFFSYRDCRVFMEHLKHEGDLCQKRGLSIRTVTLGDYFSLSRRLRAAQIAKNVSKDGSFIRDVWALLIRTVGVTKTGKTERANVATDGRSRSSDPRMVLVMIPDSDELAIADRLTRFPGFAERANSVFHDIMWCGVGTPVFVSVTRRMRNLLGLTNSSIWDTVFSMIRNVYTSQQTSFFTVKEPEGRTERLGPTNLLEARAQQYMTSSPVTVFMCHKDAQRGMHSEKKSKKTSGIAVISLEALLEQLEVNSNARRILFRFKPSTSEARRLMASLKKMDSAHHLLGKAGNSIQKQSHIGMQHESEIGLLQRMRIRISKLYQSVLRDWRVIFGFKDITWHC